MTYEKGVKLILTYDSIKRFDDRLKRLEEGMQKLLSQNTVEKELRDELDKLKGEIAGAVDKTDVIEQGAREGLPTTP